MVPPSESQQQETMLNYVKNTKVFNIANKTADVLNYKLKIYETGRRKPGAFLRCETHRG